MLASGSVAFSESTRHFADNDLGDGSTIDLMVRHWRGALDELVFEMSVVIEWLDWNEFLWRRNEI